MRSWEIMIRNASYSCGYRVSLEYSTKLLLSTGIYLMNKCVLCYLLLIIQTSLGSSCHIVLLCVSTQHNVITVSEPWYKATAMTIPQYIYIYISQMNRWPCSLGRLQRTHLSVKTLACYMLSKSKHRRDRKSDQFSTWTQLAQSPLTARERIQNPAPMLTLELWPMPQIQRFET